MSPVKEIEDLIIVSIGRYNALKYYSEHSKPEDKELAKRVSKGLDLIKRMIAFRKQLLMTELDTISYIY